MTLDRWFAAALAAFGAVSAVPIALAQLDFAGIVNVFGIDSGDTRHAVLVLAGAAGALTLLVIALALAGGALALLGCAAARPLLLTAAITGLISATPLLWIPAGSALGAAAWLARPRRPSSPATLSTA